MNRLTPRQLEALKLIAEGRMHPVLVKEDDGWHARWRSASGNAAVGDWLDEYVRRAVVTPLYADAEDQRHETLHDAWIAALRSHTGLVRWDEAECAEFAAELAAWAGSGEEASRASVVFRLKSDRRGFSLECALPRSRSALKALGQAVYVWGALRNFHTLRPGLLGCALDRHEVEDFLLRGARELRTAGYGVEGDELKADITATVDLRSSGCLTPTAVRLPNLQIRIAGETASAEEIRFLLEQHSSLVFFRNRWIEVDVGLLKEALRALERRGHKAVPSLAFALGIGAVGRLEVDAAEAGGSLRMLIETMRRRGEGLPVPATPGFAGELRDYQRRGVAWLKFLTERGIGALLADDMGLGKTIEVIAWMLAAPRPRRTLVVAPLTLVANWAHELGRFAPSLRVYVHHGANRHFASGFRRAVEDADVVITSVNMLLRDHSAFAEIAWSALVVDEAQLMKNPDTQLARAIRALSPPARLALTGTPVENSLADLWSLEEFLNPGLLGERRAFEERFVRPLKADPSATAGRRLKHALEPLVLRRLKTDPAIAAELGPKHEVREYCALTPAQRTDYEAALADYRASERRQGDAFALLTRLKLVCDDFSSASAAAETAGKFERLVALLEEIFANGESALVFTQYAKVGARLKAALAAKFARPIAFLHGGLSAAERKAEIAGFVESSSPSAFILSLKAGGVGLNLVKATHVIHYDRWWNPAAENQATDRAHRIGQRRPVFVHLMITAGTVEEHVDEILRRKQSLGALLQDGEALWKAVTLA